MIKHRYLVEYVHLDGNRYRIGETNIPELAQALADEAAVSPTIRRLHLPVLITDRENPERGDLNGRLLDYEAEQVPLNWGSC